VLLEGRDWSLAERSPGVGGQLLRVRGLHTEYADAPIYLFGEHAARNAAAAVIAVEALLDRALDDESVRAALSGLTSPGRLEVVHRRPVIVLDGAHNPAGARAVAATLAEAFAWERLHLVIGVSANKDVDGIVAALAPLADEAHAVANSSARSAPAEVVVEALRRAGADPEVHASVAAGVDAARSAAAEDDLILVTGSLYTVADARRALVPGP
jgi:dihydrofolate synthase / folylpolyglutamate synthase